ncbi:MAG: acyl-CoA thioesterase [Lachnospiraceae bacterium]|nr:acyl-CoA thioesterase [Lachnospiraceae bacterium]
MEVAVYRRKVNYYETDQMGVVHHSNYIRYFEEARIDLMEKVGLPYADMEENGLIIPVLSVECHYGKPVLFGKDFEVHSRLVKFDGLKMEFVYEIWSEGQLCTTGNSKHCFLDKDMKPVRMKRVYPEIFQKMKELVEG